MTAQRVTSRIGLSALILAAAATSPVLAQVPAPRNGYQYFVVSSCGTAPYSPLLGSYGPPTVDIHGNVCGSGSGGGGGGGGGAVYGPDAVGNTPTQPPVLQGLLDSSGKIHQLSSTFPMPSTDLASEAALGTVSDTAAAVGGNGSIIAQLKQAVTQSAAVKTALGSPLQAGGSIGNTGFNALQGGNANSASNPFFVTTTNPTSNTVSQGTPAAVGNAWPITIVQGGSALSASNPTFEQTVGPSMQAPGTAPTIVRGIQGAPNGIPVNTSGPETNGSAPLGGGNRVMGSDGSAAHDVLTTTTGALEPPTAASGKIIEASCNLAANTSTALGTSCTRTDGTSGGLTAAMWASAISEEIQPDGTAIVGISLQGTALTSPAGAAKIIPAGSYPIYNVPDPTRVVPTAYTGTAQTVRVTLGLR